MGASDDRTAADLRRVAVGAAAVALLATWWVSHQGLQLLYADTRSHLTIARRLVDGPNRGLVQLGTVWLPLQHLLLAPFSALDALWTSGWAGALVGAACLAVEAAALWHVTTVLNRDARFAGLVVVVLYVTNPTILFLHTSAFAEPVLYAAVLLTAAALVHWAVREKPYSGGEMALYCGGPAALAVLARYDGWAFALVWALCIAVMSWRRWGSRRYAGKMTLCFAAPPLGAALWWLWFNWVNFGDPLEFQRGRYSAQAQQQVLADQGLLPDQGDLPASVGTFLRSAWIALGWVTLVGALAGLVVLAIRARRRDERARPPGRVLALVLVLTATPVVFYVWSLFTGQVALRFGDAAGESIFNLRYGAAVFPGLAVLAATALAAVGGAVWWRRVVALGLAAAPFVALAVVPGWREVGVVEEALEQRQAGDDQWAAAEWLERDLGGGRVLVDDSVNPMLPVIGAGLDDVVAPFSRDWDETLRDPGGVTHVFVDQGNPDDQVGQALAADPDLLDGFDVAAEFGPVVIYRSQDAP
ncbi:MAG: hypothetical protein JNK12_12805 [Acidimicrobiales bacterium]|nr:hypothetical protein [Acidimicrobiales bacterium]